MAMHVYMYDIVHVFLVLSLSNSFFHVLLSPNLFKVLRIGFIFIVRK